MASSSATYASLNLLDKPADSFERPKPFPTGSYVCKVAATAEGKWPANDRGPERPFLRFMFAPLAAGEDVDPSSLPDEIRKRFGSNAFSHPFTLTEEDLWRLAEFLTKHLSIDETGKSMRQMIAESMGRMVLVHVGVKPDGKDPSIEYNEIKGFEKVPD